MRTANVMLLIGLSVLTASATETMKLWPHGAPGEKNGVAAEHDTTKPGDALVAGQPGTNTSRPTVMVCPGGGYQILAMDLEGTEVCHWLNSIGVNAVLLKYRVPPRHDARRYLAPLQDAQRALSLVRFHAAEWGIDPKHLGIMGFSAGGNLAALASTRFSERSYPSADEADHESCRPDFAMLIYPAYLVSKTGPQLAPELTVTSNTPPAFLVQTEDDPIHVENSLYYYLALKRAGVPAEMHLFACGGHGYGLRESRKPVTVWPKLAEHWLRQSVF
jgi:acetyl esterase/lipase